MDIYSSGEDVIIKTRKPYTITKQREKWTEEEHNRFLEALKLYGRAWQRIEEHIGTKTAVQIRSHAQKFFSKLEKEALTKGIPFGQAHGIEIPPPRPKRKPNNPYPRKTFVSVVPSSGEGKNNSSGSSLCSKKKVFDMEMDTPQENAPCTFFPPARKGSMDAYIFREFVPPVNENKEKTADDDYPPAVKGKKGPDNADAADLDIGRFEGPSINTQMKLAQEWSAGLQQPQSLGTPPRNELQGSGATGLVSLSNQAGSHATCNVDTTPAISATTEHHTSTSMSSVHHSFAAFPPFTQVCSSQDAYRSFHNMSSAFSSLIISTLLQNPAAHAAASLAASFWPSVDVETSTGSTSETFVGEIPVRLNPSPSMAAIAAATVAAASAWWATHGLLPFCHPAFHSGFAFAPAPTGAVPRTETAQVTEDNKQGKDEVAKNPPRNQQTTGPEFSAPGTLQSSPLSASDSDVTGRGGRSHNTTPKSPTESPVNPTPESALQVSEEARSKKKVDRSSCGSNTASSSEVETDTILKNLEEGTEDTKEVLLSHPSPGDINNRRLRGGGGNVGESWKEVSQEGRLAFQALFSRQVLPQSFSPRHAKDETTQKAKEEKGAAVLAVDLNSKVSTTTDIEERGSNTDQGFLSNKIELGKLKSRRTGFKPYKRCSMEAKESIAAPIEQKDNKRIRLEGKALT